MTPSEAPKALQASECSELLDPTRANCWISAQHQPGKFTGPAVGQQDQNLKNASLVPCCGKREARTGSPNPQCLETLAGNGWSLPVNPQQHNIAQPSQPKPCQITKALNDFTFRYNNPYRKWTIEANRFAKQFRSHTRSPPSTSQASWLVLQWVNKARIRKDATLVPCSRKREARSGSPNPQCLDS